MLRKAMLVAVGVVVLTALLGCLTLYMSLRIDVPSGHIAVLTHKVGQDIPNDSLVAPDDSYKGVMLSTLNEGRYFYNPYSWDWGVYPMVEIPGDKLGIRIRQYGENLPYGQFLVLRPGRYNLNAVIRGSEDKRPKKDYVEIVELHPPVIIPAGHRGVVVNLAGPFAEDPNVYLVEKGFRGVQRETLKEGTYYLNPYEYRVHVVDCRSQRYNLAESHDMGFPSRDGFWISLDAVLEYRINPEKAAEVFVIYNEVNNDQGETANIQSELVSKVIMPNARAFCRIQGSNRSGREFIGGDTRTAFQKNFQEALKKNCDPQGVEIIQALITKIKPPTPIAKPVQDREVFRQNLNKFNEQKLQQIEEAKLATEKALIEQKKELVQADQKVVQVTTEAKQRQQVEVTQANQAKAVAITGLEAGKDRASAILSRKKAEANIIELQNAAEAAGWRKAVESFGGDGDAYARYVMYTKLAPAFSSILANSSNSPLMDIFGTFATQKLTPKNAAASTPTETEKK